MSICPWKKTPEKKKKKKKKPSIPRHFILTALEKKKCILSASELASITQAKHSFMRPLNEHMQSKILIRT